MSTQMATVGREGLNRSSSNRSKVAIFIGGVMTEKRTRLLKNKMNDYWKHREKRLSTHKAYRDRLAIEAPWRKKYWTIRQRCSGVFNKSYITYIKKGIKLILTEEQLKDLWFRDKAYLMKQPSIDRIDNNGDYAFENCRFIEMIENTRRERKAHRQFICIECQNYFTDFPSRNDRKFCSIKCYHEWKRQCQKSQV